MFDCIDFTRRVFIGFTGGGGKTTLMLRLAERLSRLHPVVVTTTTRMGMSEVPTSQVLLGNISLPEIEAKIREEGRVFLFQKQCGDKYLGFAPEIVESFYHMPWAPCVLVEADGSKRLPLKGYAEYEPPLPVGCEWQIVVVGVDALLQPLNEHTVARFEILQKFLEVERGAYLTPQLLLRLLTSRAMYLKNSPTGARRVLCLNKADFMAPDVLEWWVNCLRAGLSKYDGIEIAGWSGGYFCPLAS